MKNVCVVLGDQLTENISCIKAIDKKRDMVLMCKVQDEATYVKHHPQKIIFVLSAMRHFAQQLTEKGYNICYVALDDKENTQSLCGEIKRFHKKHSFKTIYLTMPGEYRLKHAFQSMEKTDNFPIKLLEDDRFLCTSTDFNQWACKRKTLRMEDFYRWMRRKYNVLMNEGAPYQGQWNFDKQNRHAPDKKINPPSPVEHAPDDITQTIIKLVTDNFSNHFGDIECFNYAVTRQQALYDVRQFMDEKLSHFGFYQDSMVIDEPFLYHARLSAYLNIGFLTPLELCQMAEDKFKKDKAPIEAVEGFIRQILGWREFMRGIYWLKMPEYVEKNDLNATRDLPDVYWGGKTRMRCMEEAVSHTKQYAYSHHIQRLMITGNFALLAGLDVKAVCEWYLAVYADAYEWVELPNTLGMALFGDGGVVASKPYAASGKYIHRMSNFCQSCQYSPLNMTEDNACPFNALYWRFMDVHQNKLKNNQRMRFAYLNWNKKTAQKQKAILDKAKSILIQLSQNTL